MFTRDQCSPCWHAVDKIKDNIIETLKAGTIFKAVPPYLLWAAPVLPGAFCALQQEHIWVFPHGSRLYLENAGDVKFQSAQHNRYKAFGCTCKKQADSVRLPFLYMISVFTCVRFSMGAAVATFRSQGIFPIRNFCASQGADSKKVSAPRSMAANRVPNILATLRVREHLRQPPDKLPAPVRQPAPPVPAFTGGHRRHPGGVYAAGLNTSSLTGGRQR